MFKIIYTARYTPGSSNTKPAGCLCNPQAPCSLKVSAIGRARLRGWTRRSRGLRFIRVFLVPHPAAAILSLGQPLPTLRMAASLLDPTPCMMPLEPGYVA